MGKPDVSLKKHQRLKSSREIQMLYDTGESFLMHPFVFYYKYNKVESGSLLLVSVSKRKLRKATDRNFLKRRMREAFRLNRPIINGKLTVGIVYIGNEPISFHEIQSTIRKGVEEMSRLIPTN